MDYGLRVKVNLSFKKAIEKVKEELLKEGFGVLTEINVKETLKKKINVDFKNYIILGACNPNFAYKALQEETELGLLLPCNVIVYETFQTDKVSEGLGIVSKKNSLKNEEIFVSAINPQIGMGFIENENLEKISKEVKEKLQKVISNLNREKW